MSRGQLLIEFIIMPLTFPACYVYSVFTQLECPWKSIFSRAENFSERRAILA